MDVRFLEVVSLDGEVVRRIDVSGRSEGEVERIERGLLRNMDMDRFYVRDSFYGEAETVDEVAP